MRNFLQKQLKIDAELKYLLTISVSLGLGMFLLFLFFQPFTFSDFSYNNLLLFLSGFGFITFFCILFFQNILPRLLPKWFSTDYEENEPVSLSYFLIWIFTSVAFAFYIRYVGLVMLSMYMVFKVIFICLVPVVLLWFVYKYKKIKALAIALEDQNIDLKSLLKEYGKDHKSGLIEIFSDNRSEKVTVRPDDLILIRSADNYIEIDYKGDDKIEKVLIRNTLKSIEVQLALYPNIIRCHRSYLVNLDNVEKLVKKNDGYKVRIKDVYYELPVSRQYLLELKKALEAT
jgi:hypothetical protein